MSAFLWKHYFDNDVDGFRHVLARAAYNTSTQGPRGVLGAKGGITGLSISPGAAVTNRSRKQSGPAPSGPSVPSNNIKSLANVTLNRADINWGTSFGVTLLHEIASSTNNDASEFGVALLESPLLDLYAQDEESGWTALHRALYFGNITIARALMQKDIQYAVYNSISGTGHAAGSLIKIKDREGYSPFDVYGATIGSRFIHQASNISLQGSVSEDDENEAAQGVTGDVNEGEGRCTAISPRVQLNGDELFVFGSNKNFTLGFGDEDDRQFPERIVLKRPDHLFRRFNREYRETNPQDSGRRSPDEARPATKIEQLPAIVRHRPIIIQDIQLSKLHSAVLTTDPEANLYICGFGSGGRLGTGDEMTRFGFVNIHGGALMGKKVIHVGLGQDHTIAISCEGETFSWGSNTYGQLGYALNSGTSGRNDENPLQLLPRQIFGPLKRESIVGAAASRVHSVVHSSGSLYTFGKNEGQLGLVDSDARSLVIQNTPRKVGASLFHSAISAVSAIEKATICLLDDHDVWVFANYGYTKVSFPTETFSNYFLDSAPNSSRGRTSRYGVKGNEVCKITSGGDTICAMTSRGDVFTIRVSQKTETSTASTSTTNPSKIRGALSAPQRVWSLKKGHMAVRDVDVGQDGSIIICTESGSVWERVKRAKIKDATAAGLSEQKAKDYKFSRVPRLTRITAVRSNAFGAFAAVRRDSDVLKTQVDVEACTLWDDLHPLLSFQGFGDEDSETEYPTPRFWAASQSIHIAMIRRAVMTATNLEEDIADFLAGQDTLKKSSYDLRVGTTLSETRLPLHEFMLAGRSPIAMNALSVFREAYFFSIPEVMTIEYDKEGKALLQFQGVDFITILNLVLYLYTDSVVDVWHHTRQVPESAFRYRQVRTELMRIASHLELRKLEHAVRALTVPPKTLHEDLEMAIAHNCFFESGDVQIELDGSSIKVHSALMCQRCPFFEGLFQGRAAGLWLSSRREHLQEPKDKISVDLKHVDPNVFQYVLQHIYGDTDERMFDNVVTSDFEAYLDLIMEVLSVANELMLERLAQICQKIIGRYVNTRNVCQLLNAIAPCSVAEFKNVALEYICLNLEGMLENHLLDELDDDLMLELDVVVRQNQLHFLPTSKIIRDETKLIEKYPELVEMRARHQKTKVDQVYLHAKLLERESRYVAGSKFKATLLEDFETSPSTPKAGRKPSHSHNSRLKSPLLKAQKSSNDLMFEMEDSGDSEMAQRTPSHHRRQPIRDDESPHLLPTSDNEARSFKDHGYSLENETSSLADSANPSSIKALMTEGLENASTAVKPWASPTMSTSKLDMKDIMAQASSSRISNISSGISHQSKQADSPISSLPGKVSQRERKKQQQEQHSPQRVAASSPTLNSASFPHTPTSPWQVASRGPKVSLKDVLGAETGKSPVSDSVPLTPPMTLRQTVSGKASTTRRTASGPTQSLPLPHPNRSVSTPTIPRPLSTTATTSSSTTIPQKTRSIRHNIPPRPVSPTLNLSMAEILSQQQVEKEIIQEVAAKRSLQEIQEEQAFQEWWDQESRKVRGEAEREAKRGDEGNGKGKGKGGSRGGRKGRDGSRGRGGGGGNGVGGGGSGGGSGRGKGKGKGREEVRGR